MAKGTFLQVTPFASLLCTLSPAVLNQQCIFHFRTGEMFCPQTGLLGLSHPETVIADANLKTLFRVAIFLKSFSLLKFLFEATKAHKRCRCLKALILLASNTQIHTQVFKTSASKMIMAHCGRFLMTTTTFGQ